MDHLPLELIEKILSHSFLSIEDVVNFSSTCRRFRNSVLSSSIIWNKKFHDNFPKFTDLFDNTHTNFFEEIRYIHELNKRTVALLETMSSRLYTKYLLSEIDLEEWDKLMNERKETYYYLISNLTEIIKVNEPINSIEIVPLNTPGNKTLQYYAQKALRFIKQQHLTGIWENFQDLPPRKQVLEKAVGLVAQWYQADTDLSDKDIDNGLDKIATLVKQRLFEMNPNHQIFKATHLEKLKEEKLVGNLWPVDECRQVMVAMREVLYIDLGFYVGGEQDSYFEPDKLLINKVMEYRIGFPIMLAIIYECVGRRLGLLFQTIVFSDDYVLLKFTETEGSKHLFYYIHPVKNGAFVEEPTGCRARREPTEKIVERVVRNLHVFTKRFIGPNGRDTLQQSMLELQLLIVTQMSLCSNTSDRLFEAVENLAKLYTSHKVYSKRLEPYTKWPIVDILRDEFPTLLKEILTLIENTMREPDDLNIETKSFQVQRPEDIKYAVGMIIEDCSHDQQCVIYNWVSEYESPPFQYSPPSPSLSPSFIITHKHRNKQPHYIVLVEDGSSRILPQDVVAPSSDVGRLLTHKKLGRYFSHFCINHFVPNAEKEREYPWDREVRHKYYYDQLLKQHPF